MEQGTGESGPTLQGNWWLNDHSCICALHEVTRQLMSCGALPFAIRIRTEFNQETEPSSIVSRYFLESYVDLMLWTVLPSETFYWLVFCRWCWQIVGLDPRGCKRRLVWVLSRQRQARAAWKIFYLLGCGCAARNWRWGGDGGRSGGPPSTNPIHPNPPEATISPIVFGWGRWE